MCILNLLKKPRCAVISTLLLCGSFCIFPTQAQGIYPDRPVRIVSGFAVGGSLDLIARLVADQLTQRLGQTFLVDVKTGAGGGIAAADVAKAKPDGYTLLLGFDGTLAIGPNLTTKATYDSVKDFEPISKLADVPLMIAANPMVPARNVAELIALSKSKPGSLSFGSSGLGTTPHLGGELLRSRAGMDWTHIPYRGGAVAVTDVISGTTPLIYSSIGPLLPFLKSGKIVGIGIANSKRSAAVPDVPAFRESGINCCDVMSWYALLGPAGTPRAVVDKLHGEVVAILQKPEVIERLVNLGLEASYSTPQQLGETIKVDLARWKQIIRDSKIPLTAQ